MNGELKYKCLILDHDDTAVNSTAEIHYPAHLEVLKILRPDTRPISLDEWFLKNFNPGIMEYLIEELKFTEQEIQIEYEIWREFTSKKIPHFYPGFIDALREYRTKGGIVAVVSHSEKDIIERDYRSGSRDYEFLPDIIYGWDYDERKRKPSPFPVQRILKACHLKPSQALIVDDLKPGVVMARGSGVPVAAAGWGHCIAEIRDYMKKHCLTYFEKVEDFHHFILTIAPH